MGRICRRIVLVCLLGGALAVAPTAAASAHVHGITPLLQCSVDQDNAGGNQTDVTPASATNDGPISGLIPRDVGSAPLTIGDAGFSAPVQCP